MAVRVVQGAGHLGQDARGVAPGEAAAAVRQLGEGAALQVLERDVEDARLRVAADVVYDDDAGMLQAGGHPGFGEEAGLEGLAVLVAGDRRAGWS